MHIAWHIKWHHTLRCQEVLTCIFLWWKNTHHWPKLTKCPYSAKLGVLSDKICPFTLNIFLNVTIFNTTIQWEGKIVVVQYQIDKVSHTKYFIWVSSTSGVQMWWFSDLAGMDKKKMNAVSCAPYSDIPIWEQWMAIYIIESML